MNPTKSPTHERREQDIHFARIAQAPRDMGREGLTPLPLEVLPDIAVCAQLCGTERRLTPSARKPNSPVVGLWGLTCRWGWPDEKL